MPEHQKQRSSRAFNLDRKRLLIVGGVAVVIIGVIVSIIVAGGSNTPAKGHTNTTAVPAVATNRCPLTDLPAAGGAVPARPALLVKIGNEPGAGTSRPQSGLNEADIVFDTPAEGFIMRYMAVYQCSNATEIGPTRSVRWVDYHLARMFLHPILAFAGGINPNVDAVMSDHWLEPANLLNGAASAGTRISTRVAPDNLYTSTSALWALYKSETTPPPPVFAYSSSVPATAALTTSAQINFSAGTDVVWRWNSATSTWVHSYTDTGTDVDPDTSQPVTTTNVVILIANYLMGPYIESTGGSGDVESQVQGTGPGYVLRNGKRVAVTWSRKDLIDGFSFTDAHGTKVALAPGRTWVEIVPNTVAATKGNLTFTS